MDKNIKRLLNSKVNQIHQLLLIQVEVNNYTPDLICARNKISFSTVFSLFSYIFFDYFLLRTYISLLCFFGNFYAILQVKLHFFYRLLLKTSSSSELYKRQWLDWQFFICLVEIESLWSTVSFDLFLLNSFSVEVNFIFKFL